MTQITTTGPAARRGQRGRTAGRARQPFFTGMPCSPNHPGFRMTLIRRHGDMVRPDGGSAANEIIVTGGHVGTHVDALSHVSHDGQLHGGVDAADAQQGGRFSELGAEHTPGAAAPRRAARRRRRARRAGLPPGHGVTARPTCEAAAERRGVERGGATSRWCAPAGRGTSTTPSTYLGQGRRRAGRDRRRGRAGWPRAASRATGADTTAYEQIPAGDGPQRAAGAPGAAGGERHLHHRAPQPGGRGRGRAHRFVFVLAPLRIVGGTGSPVRPFAAVSA